MNFSFSFPLTHLQENSPLYDKHHNTLQSNNNTTIDKMSVNLSAQQTKLLVAAFQCFDVQPKV